MPTYEYICENCGHEWEDFHSMSEVVDVCPECNQQQVKKLISFGSKGIVKLCHEDMVAKIGSDLTEIRQKARKDENYKASLIGEDRYHQSQIRRR